MASRQASRGRMRVVEVEEFLREPPRGFSVKPAASGLRVRCDPQEHLVLIDDLDSCCGRVAFDHSLGREVKMRNLQQYSSTRRSLVSKRIHLLVSLCNGEADREAPKQYVVTLEGSDPLIKWQLERGLDRTIASVAGESYRVDVDLTEALETWAGENLGAGGEGGAVWRDASFALKYHSDALFDFPHWFGFSRRNFKLRLT